MLAADYGGWPFKNAPHSMTAAQRSYIAATREENAPPEKEKPELLSRSEWQAISDRAQAAREGTT